MAESGEYQGVTPTDLEDLKNVDHNAGVQVGDALVVTAVDGNGRVHWEAAAANGSGTSRTVACGPIDYNTADLDTGVDLYTPTPGEWLLDAWPVVVTAFNGTTPQGDIALAAGFAAQSEGFFSAFGAAFGALGAWDSDGSGGIGGSTTGMLEAGQATQLSLASRACRQRKRLGTVAVHHRRPATGCRHSGRHTGWRSDRWVSGTALRRARHRQRLVARLRMPGSLARQPIMPRAKKSGDGRFFPIKFPVTA